MAPRSSTAGKDVTCVTNALDVLSCFSLFKPEWGVTEISDHLGMFKSAAHRYLRTLELAGYVESTETRRYRLGVRALELGNIFRLHASILRAAEAPLLRLSEETGFTTHVFQMDGRDVLELYRFGTEQETPLQTSSILRRLAHATAAGKVLLAHSGQSSIDNYIGMRKFLHRYSPHTVYKPDQLRTHLRQVRDRGFAMNLQESSLGRVCMAVPVVDRSGGFIAAISVSTSPARLGPQNQERYLPILQAVASEVRARLR